MGENINIQLFSNVKIIRSGNKPTTDNLLPGQMAFGKINEDGKYHLFGNTGEGEVPEIGTVVDIIVDTMSTLTLEEVLNAGNTTTLDITFDASTGNTTIVGHDGITVSDGSRALTMKAGEGFKDAGFAVLSANPANTVDASAQTQMRKAIDVLSKSEIQALIAGVYKVKGTKTSFSELTSDTSYTPTVGDVWNIETAGGEDKNGNAIKAGDNVVFTGGNKATDWDVLSGVVDLSGYYTKADIDGIKTGLESKITKAQNQADKGVADAATAQAAAEAAQRAADAADVKAQNAQAAANNAQSDIDAVKADYVKSTEFNEKAQAAIDEAAKNRHFVEDEHYQHTDNNYTSVDKAKVDKLDFSGDGTKVLTNDGTFKTIVFAIKSI